MHTSWPDLGTWAAAGRRIAAAVLLIAVGMCFEIRGGGRPGREEPAAQRAAGAEELLEAARALEADLIQLLTLAEEEVRSAARTAEVRSSLCHEGVMTRTEVERAERDLATAQARADETRSRIEEVMALIAEVEAEEQPPAPTVENATPRSTARTTRSPGSGGWSLSGIAQVRGFFALRFGRALPVSAFGQTALHNRLGFDHRNSADVAVHPDSAEGRALMAFLRDAGIPFLAFRSAIPGKATGAHIHIGHPSRRL